jgi:hypothetical protein
MAILTATTYDATFGAVTVTRVTDRAFLYAVIRVADDGAVASTFHTTRVLAERAAGKPAPGITRHVVETRRKRPPVDTVVVRSTPAEVDAINASIGAQGGITELPAGAGIGDAMRSELNRGVMVSWINADLLNRADCDIRRSVVLWDADRDFIMAMGADITPALFRQRLTELPNLVAHMYGAGVRYWSVGIN